MSASDSPKQTRFSSARSVREIMAMVLLALIPGIAVSTDFGGADVLIQISLALAFALIFEAAMLKLRAQPITLFLTDFSAPLTAVLFALLIPPSAPWWIAATGMTVAIVVAKQLYGGLGCNLFNPAMAGFVAAKLCFPQAFDLSLSPEMAVAGDLDGRGNELLALAYAAGGIFLFWKKIIPWQTPVATLAATIFLSLCLPFVFPNSNFGAMHSTFPALWLLGAFFIVTDPVTSCISARGRWLFGLGVGALGVLIGHWNGNASGFAFAVLLMNGLAPWIDRQAWTKARRRAPAHMDANA